MRESYIEIDGNRLKHNLNLIKKHLDPGTKILANLKANAYGLGAYEIGSFLEQSEVTYFSVAYINEAIALRQKGIHTNLLVFNPSFDSFDELITYNLEPQIGSLAYLNKLTEYISRGNITGLPVHIKLDTGMHRAGIMPEELYKLIQILQQNKNIVVKSVFSHLAAAEDPEEDAFTRKQIETFELITNKLSANLNSKFFRHLLNTAGIFRFPQARYDMVRPGLGLFGLYPVAGQEDSLQPIARVKTKINQIKELKAGDTVGYNRRYKVTDNKRIGLLPLGYADGIDRRLGNGNFYVKCKGYNIPVVGTINMDSINIDLSDTPCRQGDEVIVFDNDRSIYDIACRLNTIPYEIIAGLSERLPRKII